MTTTIPDEKKHRRAINAWALYDWANSAFATTVLAALLPVYYQSVAGANLPGNRATVYWGYTTSISLLIAALLSPILGAVADFRGAKKRFLTYFVLMGAAGTAMLYWVGTGDWLLASLIFVVGEMGFASANVFYDALLPHVARSDEMDQVSAKGFALGYLGGGLLLAINLVTILLAPEGQTEQMTRLAFVSVAIWWLLFPIPLWLYVPEPQRRVEAGEAGRSAFAVGFRRLAGTFREIRKYREVLKFVLALWLYSDGIGTVIKVGVAYGAEIGISQTTLVGTLLAVQFASMPFAFAYGWLAKRIGVKPSIYLGLAVYSLATIFAFLMQTDLHFLLLGLGIATVQGGTQAITRSLGARMIPKSKSGEFFGFISTSIKFAGIAGPLLFAAVGQVMGSSRLAILSLVVFFIGGALLLTRVDVEEGMRVAREEDAALLGRSPTN